jgi:hypothetical protein
MQVVDSEGYLKVKLVGGPVGPFVPYTGATGNVDLGTHTLSAKNIIVNHASGSGVAVSITKGGSGEALTVVKTSGSGNAMSVTGGDVEFGTGFFWDNTNARLGIGTDTPASKLFLDGGVFTKKYYTNTTNQTINFGSAFELFGTPHSSNGFTFFINPSAWSSGWDLRIGDSTNSILFNRTSGITVNKLNSDELVLGGGSTLSFYRVSPATGFSYNSAGGWNFVLRGSSSENLRVVGSTGNVLINTTTDAGFKLDVNGTARVNGSSFFATTSGTLVSGTTTIVNMNYGEVPKTYLTGGTFMNGTVQFPTTLRVIATGGGIQFAQQSAPSPNSILFFGNDSTGVYYGNYGSLPLKFMTSAVTQMTIFGTGNVGINTTTDAGFKLDVNGTARVSAANGLSAFQITAPTRAWYFTTSQQGGTFNAISGSANGSSGTGNFGYVLGGGWAFNIGLTTSQTNSFFSVYPSATNQGEVRIGGQTGNGSSLLTLESTTKGFLPPRGSNAQMLAIASPATGLIFFDNTNNKLNCYDGTTWQPCW